MFRCFLKCLCSKPLLAMLCLSLQVDGLRPAVASPQEEETMTTVEESAPVAEKTRVGDEDEEEERVARRLQALFSHIEAFRDVQVTYSAGVVRLEGEVAGIRLREEAGELARSLPGVLYVENGLEATREVERRLAPALHKVTSFLEEFLLSLPLYAVAVLLILAFWYLSSLLSRLDRLFGAGTGNPFLRARVRQLVQVFIFLGGVLLALEVLDATALVGAVLGTAGIVGLAVGFAFKDIVENYLAGTLLSLRRPFASNDHIRIGEHEGRVVRLTSRETILLTPDGNHLRLPNSLVFNGVMTNFTRNPMRRFSFEVGVGTDEDLVEVQSLGRSILLSVEGVLSDPGPAVQIERLGESSVQVRCFGWVDQRQADFVKVRSEAVRLVKAGFDRARVEMPEPIQQIRLQRARHPELPPAVTTKPPETAGDVSVDRTLERQIEEERSKSSEEDFLERDENTGAR